VAQFVTGTLPKLGSRRNGPTIIRKGSRKVIPISYPVADTSYHVHACDDIQTPCPISFASALVKIESQRRIKMAGLIQINNTRGRSTVEVEFSEEVLALFADAKTVKALQAPGSTFLGMTQGMYDDNGNIVVIDQDTDGNAIAGSDPADYVLKGKTKNPNKTAQARLEDMLTEKGLIPEGYRVSFSTKAPVNQIAVKFRQDTSA
jgi:hypothetical protein